VLSSRPDLGERLVAKAFARMAGFSGATPALLLVAYTGLSKNINRHGCPVEPMLVAAAAVRH
jgi:hypothetical protein